MHNGILDALEDLGYTGPLLEEGALKAAAQDGASSVELTQLVEWIVDQLSKYCGIDEKVSAIQSPEDASNFLMELSGFLREFSCPHQNLTEGPMESRLNSMEACFQLLEYLLGELSAVKMIALKKPGLLSSQDASLNDSTESEEARHLREMLIALGFSKPPPNITPVQLFNKLEAKIKELMSKYPDQAGQPLLKSRLSPKQWSQLLAMNAVLLDEYRVRREMLLKRLDVTIQSFKWSDKAKNNENQIAQAYQPIRSLLVAKTNVGVPQILAARDDLTRLQKTSSGKAREETKCAINKVLIGKVPDRGGRAWELEPPPPEMPAFMKRDASSAGSRGGYQGRGGGGGGGGYQGEEEEEEVVVEVVDFKEEEEVDFKGEVEVVEYREVGETPRTNNTARVAVETGVKEGAATASTALRAFRPTTRVGEGGAITALVVLVTKVVVLVVVTKMMVTTVEEVQGIPEAVVVEVEGEGDIKPSRCWR
ncbi:hypothetical protein EGW08_022906 [Elysia chlorotica]|uniref:Protein FAM98A n=1 Tax=Elysia chlorotica TaxID=188477 RepID=A0A3S0Z2H5_ELYCH|nr:hypothetical protein EGW08_022906 [Elysia chlorotica]